MNDMNKARAIYYALFSEIFNFLEQEEVFNSIKQKLELLSKNPIDDKSKQALLDMQNFMKKGFEALKEEQNDVFFSPITSFIPTSASYYDEARDDGAKRIEMIKFIQEINLVRDDKKYKDSEDFIGFIMLFMHQLLQNTINGDEKSQEISNKVFKEIINEFIDEFAFKVYSHELSDFYKNSAILLDTFMQVERLNLGIDKPKTKGEVK